MATLTIISPEGESRSVDLSEHNTLGRHPDNSIQVLDRIVSKSHCHIDRVGAAFVLKDLGSLNGTYINGTRVEGSQALAAGDEVTLGSTRLIFNGGLSQRPPDVTATGDTKIGRVTMSAGMVESHVRAKLSQEAEEKFMPERLVQDTALLRQDYERLRVSFELTRAIGGELDVDRLLDKILGAAFDLLGADRGVMLLIDEHGQLQPRRVRTKKGGDNEEVVLSNTILSQVLRERSAVLSSDALVDARFKGAQSIIMQGIRSSMAVPLVYSGELLGVMVLDSQVAANAFKDKDLQLTQALANQAAVAIQNSLYAQKIEEQALTRQRFERLLSPAIAELVVNGEVAVEKGGQVRDTTVFFSDIRGFTAMSERSSAEAIVQMLNEYFELMVEVIFKHEGTLDKFVGDEIMALFGAPVAHADDAHRAVSVAVEQLRVLRGWNEERIRRGEAAVEIGIGINSGELVAGYLGSSRALEYTVIGDTVNTAARLCSAAKGGEIIISRATYERVRDRFEVQELPPATVKGKAQPLKIYRVLGER
ncbi:MAG: GAF domain-containing protein [Myxococcales bacterium]|nr:GAF domain-containing protein [Myxococcales bacterium]